MKIPEEEKARIMSEVKEKCGSMSELAERILEHDIDSIPIYTTALGIRSFLEPTKEELFCITEALSSIQESDHMAYTCITRCLCNMFARMAKKDLKEDTNEEE